MAGLDRLLSTELARFPRTGRVLMGPVRQLVRAGELQREAMLRSRITEEDLLSRVREQGRERLADVKDAYLEQNGKLTVIFKPAPPAGPSGRAASGA